MKNKAVFIFAFSFIIALVFEGCNKYEDGPNISFRSRTDRVANTWKIDNYKINDDDFTSLVSGYSETFTKNGAYNYSWGILNGSGTWAFQNSDNEIKLSGTDSQASRTLVILKLEEKVFWYYYLENGNKNEFHLIAN